MSTFKSLRSDKIYLAGIILLGLSALLFCIPLFQTLSRDQYLPFFFGNFATTVTFFVILLWTKKLRAGRDGFHHMILFLILFLISAYALNRSMVVFEISVTWFSILLVVVSSNLIAFRFSDDLPIWVKHAMTFVLGISVVVFVYLSCYLIPLYIIGTMAFLVLGISLHVFVPVLLTIYSLKLMNRVSKERKSYWWSFGGGIVTIVVFTVGFIVQWSHATSQINRVYRKSTAFENNGLPGWVAASQVSPNNWITQLILKADLVYSTPTTNENSWFWRVPSLNFDEERKHDPLVMTAVLFAGKLNLPEDERIKILESNYDSRHQAQERLWSGDNLFTEEVNTSVKIWPQFAMAYTEKLVTVSNLSNYERWRNREEAIYTFHLPEGGVVTSLSLWIDGKESKAILTTKEKAVAAYKTIVGVEMRDPSLVQWQEGNTVSVRVFPVIAGQSRVFKIGITSPLERTGNNLAYQNIYFDGPSAKDASEEVRIRFEKRPSHFIEQAYFSSEDNRDFRSSGKYKSDWKIVMDDEPLSTQLFSFEGKSYFVRPYQKQRTSVDINSVFLDINRSWSKEEFLELYSTLGDKQIYVYNNGLILLTDSNKGEQFDLLSKNQFSLFPLQEIEDPQHSLLVSKSFANSPNLNDIRDSRFFKELQQYLGANQKIRLFNLGNELSPFLKSLKEFRVFHYEHGKVSDLQKLLASKQFAGDIENDGLIVIDNAEIAIGTANGETASSAPDHLMRLFAYNHILQKAGKEFLIADSLKEGLVEEAKKAYVVTPVSSLVVLETQRDYDRFNIESTEGSLQNASLSDLHNAAQRSRGAVPEPHEWALIILTAGILIYLRLQPKIRFSK